MEERVGFRSTRACPTDMSKPWRSIPRLHPLFTRDFLTAGSSKARMGEQVGALSIQGLLALRFSRCKSIPVVRPRFMQGQMVMACSKARMEEVIGLQPIPV